MAGPPNSLPPQAIMMQMINGKLVSRCVSLVAELAIADHLKDGPREAAALAAATDTHPDALYRVLRMLAGLGVFAELPDRRFQNTPLSEVLRSAAPGSVRSYARWLGTDLHWQVVTDLDHSVRTGETAMAKRHPNTPPFEVLAQYPKAQETFNDAMTGLSLADGDAIIEAYDFSQVNRVVDVGGGHGTLAMMMARAAPGATVTVFDCRTSSKAPRNASLRKTPMVGSMRWPAASSTRSPDRRICACSSTSFTTGMMSPPGAF